MISFARIPVACLVTRGDVDLAPVVESLPWRTVVWNNQAEQVDFAVYGRYHAAFGACVPDDLVYVQDDDCVLPPTSLAALLEAWRPGVVAANMPARFRHDFYEDHCLVGFGAIFRLADALAAFLRLHRFTESRRMRLDNDLFHRTCDIAFTALTPRVLVDVPYENLPWAEGADRMYRQPGHVGERAEMLRLVLAARGLEAA